MEHQKEVLCQEATPPALGQVFLWEITALQSPDTCLTPRFQLHVAEFHLTVPTFG